MIRRVILVKDNYGDYDGQAFTLKAFANFLNKKLGHHEFWGTSDEMFKMIDEATDTFEYSVDWFDLIEE